MMKILQNYITFFLTFGLFYFGTLIVGAELISRTEVGDDTLYIEEMAFIREALELEEVEILVNQFRRTHPFSVHHFLKGHELFGFMYPKDDGKYLVFVGSWLEEEQQFKTLVHELVHVKQRYEDQDILYELDNGTPYEERIIEKQAREFSELLYIVWKSDGKLTIKKQ